MPRLHSVPLDLERVSILIGAVESAEDQRPKLRGVLPPVGKPESSENSSVFLQFFPSPAMQKIVLSSFLVSILFCSALAAPVYLSWGTYSDAACSVVQALISQPEHDCYDTPPYSKALCEYDEPAGVYKKNFCGAYVPATSGPGVLMQYYETTNCSSNSLVQYAFEAAGYCSYSNAYFTSVTYSCTANEVIIKNCQGSGCTNTCRSTKKALVNGTSKCTEGNLIYKCVM
jgi:hypothetical protein